MQSLHGPRSEQQHPLLAVPQAQAALKRCLLRLLFDVIVSTLSFVDVFFKKNILTQLCVARPPHSGSPLKKHFFVWVKLSLSGVSFE